ncbi:MAG: dTDP-4-dehydrorhamnose reductase [Terriglobia bacterium]|jgi:dTDP-4-dehydrorhamnose reductase
MRILITGSKGMLGLDLSALLRAHHEVVGADLPEVDITDLRLVRAAIHGAGIDAVIHTAAFTAVDDCERRPEVAFQVNAEGTRNVAIACRESSVPLLYISTDYVFDGRKPTPYVENDTPNPLNAYGASKLQGERYVAELLRAAWIVRTSWLFGPLGKNFVRTILERARQGDSLRVVDDQFGAPTYTVDLAAKLEQIVMKGKPGIYHATNQGYCSWFEFAGEILRQAGLSHVPLAAIPTSASDRPALRPRNSRLAHTRLESEGLGLLPPWQDALKRYLARESQAQSQGERP